MNTKGKPVNSSYLSVPFPFCLKNRRKNHRNKNSSNNLANLLFRAETNTNNLFPPPRLTTPINYYANDANKNSAHHFPKKKRDILRVLIEINFFLQKIHIIQTVSFEISIKNKFIFNKNIYFF